MWKSTLEIDAELKALPDIPQLNTLYSLSTFWRNAVYSDGYTADDEWKSILKLTPYGEAVLSELRSSLAGIAQPDFMLAYFARFFHHDLFFDHQTSDSKRIRQILERELFKSGFAYRIDMVVSCTIVLMTPIRIQGPII